MLSTGVLVENAIPKERLQSLINRLHPVHTRFPLIRIGADGDGGYLIPDDLDGVGVCYSPGVSDNASFERHLLQFGIESHLADYSVDRPPDGVPVRSFTKKFLGSDDCAIHMTLDRWFSETARGGEDGEYILQMDIEGGEYLSILAASQALLAKFRIIVLEIHWVDQWAFPPYFAVVMAMFEKLLAAFHVVHNHPNGAGGLVSINGVTCPRVFELTLLRKDRSAALGFATEFPHGLDRSNSRDQADLPLPRNWWGGGRPEPAAPAPSPP